MPYILYVEICEITSKLINMFTNTYICKLFHINILQAKRFRKHWMTPPSSSPNERKHIADIRRSDTDKGLERIGR